MAKELTMTFEDAVKKSLQNRRPDLYRFLLKIGAKRVAFRKVKLKDIKIDQGIYPREGTDWDRVEIYAEAMRAGDQFPPLVTARDPKDLLVDGNHRYFALQKAGFEEYWEEEWDIPKDKLPLAAQALNSEPGNIETPLSGKEKKMAIIKDWESNIRDVELIAEALKTSPSYVRKVLSQAGLIKDRKEQMKERARKLRDEGLSIRQIAEKLKKEFGEEVSHMTVSRWLNEDVTKITQVKNVTPVSAGSSESEEHFKVYDREKARKKYSKLEEKFRKQAERAKELKEQGLSVSEIAQKLSEEFGENISEITVKAWIGNSDSSAETEDYAKYKDTAIPLATIEYWIGECRSYVETGTPPEEAVEIVGVPEDNDVRKYVVEELKERFWNKKEEEEKKKEEEIQKWVEACKGYIDAGFEPKEAAERAGVPEEIRVPVVKKLVGYKNHLHQEEEAKFKAELGPVDSRRRDIILKAYRLTSLIQEIEHKLKELDRVLEASEDEADQQMFRFYGRDHYIRNYLMFILVRGGWEKAEWFREITRLYLKFLIHPAEIDEFLEEMKEAAKKTPEQYEEEAKKFWEEHLASEAELKWKQFCEALGLPVLKEHGGDV